MNNDYKILVGSSISELEEKVKQCLDEGWKCEGGVHTYQRMYTNYCQAMSKITAPPAPKKSSTSSTKPKAATAEKENV